MSTRLFPGRGQAFAAGSRWLLWLLLFLTLGLAAQADIQEPSTSKGKGAKQQRRDLPANGVAQSLTIDQGASVEITLHAHGQTGKTLEFLIRSQPTHGSLLGPQPATRNSAIVTYIHDAASGPGTDTFTYAVQAPNSEVSAPVTVTIEIRDTAPAVVATPAELDFGTLKAGDTSSAVVTLENIGGGQALGHLDVPPPWTVDGPSDYQLGHGQRQSFRLLFAPKDGRSFSETVRFAGDAGAGGHLIGAGIGPGAPLLPVPAMAVGDASRPLPAVSAPSAPLAAPPSSPAPVAVASAATPPPPSDMAPAVPDYGAGGEDSSSNSSPLLDHSGYITTVDSGVKHLSLSGRARTSLDIAWEPVSPSPKQYRIELRYLSIDASEKVRIDWRPYAQVEVRSARNIVTATIRGLPEGTMQTIRVVAVDYSGHLAAASATLQATTLPPSTWWRFTILRLLLLLLAVCVFFEVRRRLETRRILHGIGESRAESADLLFRP